MNFEDIGPTLFSSNTHSRGIIRMDFDEACYLYKIVKSLSTQLKDVGDNLRVIEIGTYLGGSTALIASAGAEITSIDNYSSKTFNDYPVNPLMCVQELVNDLGLSKNVQLIHGNSTTFPNSTMECDLLFIDGNHSYEGAKADYLHWISTLVDCGSLIFHDSCKERPLATGNADVMKLMKEIPYKLITEVGSLSHFIKE